MKRAVKLAQTLTSAQPIRPLLRPILRSSPFSIAGPSTPSPAFRTIASRSYATITTEIEVEHDQAQLLDQEDILYADLAVGSPNGSRPLEIPSGVSIPPNVRFEGFENVDEPTPRGFRIHSPPASALSPISHPLSSLSAPNPTSPSSDAAVSLPSHVFAQPLRRDILHRCVVWYLSILRSGNQSSKTRSTVNYSGRKLRQQKGTGKARVGDASSGMRRGGAPIFALHPRDHAQLLPRKFRALGLATALSSKLSAGLLRVVPDLNEAGWSGTAEARRALCDGLPTANGEGALLDSTSEAASPDSGLIRRFGTPEDLSILFVHPQPSSQAELESLESFARAVRNMPGVEVLPMDEVEVYHVLKYKWCVLEKGVVDEISEVEGEEAFSMEGMEEALMEGSAETEGERVTAV